MAKQDKSPLFIVAYIFTWLSGIIVYATSRPADKRIRFHALQSIFLGIIIFILAFIPFVGMIGFALWILGIIVGIIAYDGRDISLPWIGDYAKKHSK